MEHFPSRRVEVEILLETILFKPGEIHIDGAHDRPAVNRRYLAGSSCKNILCKWVVDGLHHNIQINFFGKGRNRNPVAVSKGRENQLLVERYVEEASEVLF